jgi:hypothetical protein
LPIANLIPPEVRRYLTGGSSNIYAIRARAELSEGAVYILEAVIELTPRQPTALAHPRMAAGVLRIEKCQGAMRQPAAF